MPLYKKKYKRKINPMLSQKNLEVPLNNGFRRILVRGEKSGLKFVYYVAPDDKYLKDISEVCDWIENQKQEDFFNSSNFNFVAKKHTSHESEFIIDYTSLPADISDNVIQKKRSVAPTIVTVENDDTLSNKELTNEIESQCPKRKLEIPAITTEIPLKGTKIMQRETENPEIDSEIPERETEIPEIETEIPVKGTDITEKESENRKVDLEIPERGTEIPEKETEIPVKGTEVTERESENPNVDSGIPEIEIGIQEKETDIQETDTVNTEIRTTNPEVDSGFPEIELVISEDESGIPIKIARIGESKIESEDDSMTLSVESDVMDENAENITLKPKNPYEYPLAEVNMNSLVEIGSHCHIDRIQDALIGDTDDTVLKLMKSCCGNHCAFDMKGYPRVAFECDICLILWHSDCIGHRWLAVGPSSLIVCDNCYLIHQRLNVDLPITFCDVERLLHSEFKSDTNSNPNAPSIPLKLEAIFKLCKMQWIIEHLKTANKDDEINFKRQIKLSKKDIKRNFPNDCRYFIKTSISKDSIVQIGREPFFILKYGVEDIERIAHIFADTKCEMIHETYVKSMIDTSRVIVRNGNLLIPSCFKYTKDVEAVFYTYESGQDKDRDYIKRCEGLKEVMIKNFTVKATNSSIIIRKDPPSQRSSQLYQMPKDPNNMVSKTPGPLSSKFTVLQPKSFMKTVTIPSVSSQNLPKNAIPISMNQIQKFSNIIKIRKRKQDFSAQKSTVMSSNPATIQYNNLAELPFHILEQIMSSKSMSTCDKLNCRAANRVLKCVIDAGRVWNKVVINPGLVTGLQAMFDFFSKRNVKKMTFKIDFQESFGMEFFSSFLSRMKLYPEGFLLERLSIKLIGISPPSKNFKLSLQDILQHVKSLKCLSVTSDELVSITVGKSPNLTSDSLEKLKLKNIDNITKVLQTSSEFTPKLRTVNCGDWSRVSSFDHLTFTQVTSMRLDFSDSVKFFDITCFSMLTSLERLVISRPCINEQLRAFVGNISRHKSLTYLFLETNSFSKDQLNMCTSFGYYFPMHVKKICWKIYMTSYLMLSEPNFVRKVVEFMPHNVHVHALDM